MSSKPPLINTPLEKASHCYGNELYFDIQLGYLQRFLTKYTKRQKVAFFWNNDIGHDSLRYAKNADNPLLNFLQWLKSDGHLKNAILMFMSDHGYRLGGASTTPIGRLESTNPILRLYVPDTLKKKYNWMHANLLYNRDKLVTVHDIYPSLLDIMDVNVTDAKPEEISSVHLRPRRLFRKIPFNRTCEDAGIPTIFCIRCFETTDPNESQNHAVNILANISVLTLNMHLAKFNMCEPLTLKRIRRFHKLANPPNPPNQYKRINPLSIMGRFMLSIQTRNEAEVYLIVYETTPGHGRFEVLMKYGTDKTYEPIDLEHSQMPIRINEYGAQSACVNETILKPICYCKK